MDPFQLTLILERRLAGLPRSFRELNRSLSILGDLRGVGWQRSARRNAALDESGSPIPWYTYPAFFWLKDKVRATDRVFEWGAGHSTVWYSRRVGSVVAVDHDEIWFDQVANQAGSNAVIWLRNGRGYVDAIEEAGGSFDLICIDGLDRPACAERAGDFVAQGGAIVFDNSDHPSNYAGLESLRERGFRRIDFVGPIPAFGNIACTSVLFADDSRWLSGDTLPDFRGY